MKTIESLINPNGKVYVKMNSADDCKRFFSLAEKEGFLFGDGAKPTTKHPSDLIAVLPDKTLCYVGTYGRIAAQSGAENIIVYDCEKLLEEMIPKVRAEIKAEKDRLKAQNETAQG